MKKTMIFIFIILTLLTGCNKNNTNENITTSNTFDIFEISNDLCQ